MILDVGTGDGRAVLAQARADPAALVIGVDPDAASMAEASRRAARGATKGGLPNASFLVAAAEDLPGPLTGVADLVTVTFPWGSLLEGALGRRPAVMAGIAGVVAPGGVTEILLSVEPADRVDGLARLTASEAPAIADAWTMHGLTLTCLRPATDAEILTVPSSWARRLVRGGRRGRATWRLELRR